MLKHIWNTQFINDVYKHLFFTIYFFNRLYIYITPAKPLEIEFPQLETGGNFPLSICLLQSLPGSPYLLAHY